MASALAFDSNPVSVSAKKIPIRKSAVSFSDPKESIKIDGWVMPEAVKPILKSTLIKKGLNFEGLN
jgi:hypothetical protein